MAKKKKYQMQREKELEMKKRQKRSDDLERIREEIRVKEEIELCLM